MNSLIVHSGVATSKILIDILWYEKNFLNNILISKFREIPWEPQQWKNQVTMVDKLFRETIVWNLKTRIFLKFICVAIAQSKIIKKYKKFTN